jgi:hypothetical protein
MVRNRAAIRVHTVSGSRLPADRAKTAARDRAQRRVDFLYDRQNDVAEHMAAGTGLTAEDMEEIEILAGDVHDFSPEVERLRHEIEAAQDELRAREKALAGWKDGHGFYDANSDYDNPIVRVRYDIRTQPDGTRVMFLQEVQLPRTDQAMPAELRKHGAAIGFKWALRFAAENGLDRVAVTTGEMQARRYGLEKKVNQITWGSSADVIAATLTAPVMAQIRDVAPTRSVSIWLKDRRGTLNAGVDGGGRIVRVDAELREALGKPLSEVTAQNSREGPSIHGCQTGSSLAGTSRLAGRA